jgi:hypothetical protein
VNAHAGTPEGNGLSGNTKFVAVSWNTGGGGALAVLPHDKATRLGSSIPLIKGHTGPILDFDFSPFDDHQVCTSSEDNSVRVWQIPEGGLTSDLSDPLVVLEGHQKKVHIASYHKVASNLITSASHDHSIKIWDLTRGAAALSFDGHFSDTIWSVNWNRQGSQFVASSKDKTIRIFDPRSSTPETVSWQAHEGSKPCKALWLGRRDKILTLGFNKQSSRQLTLWDPRNVSVPLHNIDVDIAAGVFMPMYDDDSNVLYLAGKGDTSIKFYEFVDDAPHMFYLSSFVGAKPQKSACLLPKLAGDILKCEVGRIIRNTGDTLEVVSMTVPRKASDFQDDIFPETAAPIPAMTSDQWLDGQKADPIMMSCRPGESRAEAPKVQAKTVFQLQKEIEEKDAKIVALEAEVEQLRKKLAQA